MNYPIFDKLLKEYIKAKVSKEYRFHNMRKWRIDYCYIKQRLAIEIEGGIWKKGRHNRASGFIKDIEKYNEIILHGFSLLRFTPDQLNNYAIDTIIQWFKIYYPDLLK